MDLEEPARSVKNESKIDPSNTENVGNDFFSSKLSDDSQEKETLNRNNSQKK